ncbi:MAG: hypothetical protein HYR76_04030 [Ignavibacteria bacterium]|nr:hypothetical protein [Ignavibacteria bacterium]
MILVIIVGKNTKHMHYFTYIIIGLIALIQVAVLFLILYTMERPSL